MVDGKKVKYIPLLLVLVVPYILLSGVHANPSNENLGTIKEDCQGHETEILDLERTDGYGSHVFEAGASEYSACFEEKQIFIDDDYRFEEYIDSQCPSGYEAILDVHEPGRTGPGDLGSHASLEGEGQGGKLCLSHTGYKEIKGTVGSYEDCDSDYCYFLTSLYQEENSHIGNKTWSENEAWVEIDKGIPHYDINTTVIHPDHYMEEGHCDHSDCYIEIDPKPEVGGQIECPDEDEYYECYDYQRYNDTTGEIKELDLEAVADHEGWYFSHWKGDIGDEDEDSQEITVETDDDRKIDAVFTKEGLDFEVDIEGNGTVLMNRTSFYGSDIANEQIDEDDAPVEYDFFYDDRIELKAVPYGGWVFNEWSWNGDTRDRSEQDFLLQDNLTVTAEFLEYYNLTVRDFTGGNVIVDRAYEVSPGDGGHEFRFPEGRNVSLEAEPHVGRSFGSWGGDVDDDNLYDRNTHIEMDGEEKVVEVSFYEEGYCQIKICGPLGVCDHVTVEC